MGLFSFYFIFSCCASVELYVLHNFRCVFVFSSCFHWWGHVFFLRFSGWIKNTSSHSNFSFPITWSPSSCMSPNIPCDLTYHVNQMLQNGHVVLAQAPTTFVQVPNPHRCLIHHVWSIAEGRITKLVTCLLLWEINTPTGLPN